MRLRLVCCLCYAFLAPVIDARSGVELCGTYPANWREALDFHEKVERRLAAKPRSTRAAALPNRDADIGNVAVIESDDAIFGRRNPFNLDRSQITFTPVGAKYSYVTSTGGFDQVVAGSGTPITGLGDDDTRRSPLPFLFRFYGVEYRELWVNSDGNLTFTQGDSATAARSLGRLAAGPPRIAGLFSDLDPSISSASVRITSSPANFTVTWLRVPEFSDSGSGRLQSFQIRLFPDGSITLAWDGVDIDDGVVGIAPGDSTAAPLLASFLLKPTGSHDAMIAERFGDAKALDLIAAARRFYETHDDAYDYLAFFNSNGVQPGPGTLAFESSVRTNRLGIGDTPVNVGPQYGSPNRLQAVLNMGPVSNFPADPNSLHPLRFSTGDTGLTVLAHEIGHLFLAFASVRNPANPAARPMLGRQLFHWNFRFNSEASLLEGNRIRDDGPAATPRFTTTATVEGFSPLDQYLMGLRPPADVPPTFLVENATTSQIDPRTGVRFNGDRRDITIDDIIAAEGRRIPDHTVEQRRFRLAMVLIVPEGGTARPEELALLERYRDEIQAAWPRYTGNRASLELNLRRAIRLSIEPAAGAIAGSEAKIDISIQQPATAPLTVALIPSAALVDGPKSITIPAGARSVTATFQTPRPGVETLRAEPLDNPAFASTEARLNIAPAPALELRIASGNRQIATPGIPLSEPIIVKLTDSNNLPYPNARLNATGGDVTPASAFTGPDGRAAFRWTPTAGPVNRISFSLQNSPFPIIEATALSRPAFASTSVVNAASFQPGITAGAIASLFGANLAQPQVTIDGILVRILFANDGQINFIVPSLTGNAPQASVRVMTAIGAAAADVPRVSVQPGIFFDVSSRRAAAIYRGSRIFELYGTGFSSASSIAARVGLRAAAVLFSGPAPFFAGLDQINIRVDGAVPAGDQPVSLTADGVNSNEPKLAVVD